MTAGLLVRQCGLKELDFRLVCDGDVIYLGHAKAQKLFQIRRMRSEHLLTVKKIT